MNLFESVKKGVKEDKNGVFRNVKKNISEYKKNLDFCRKINDFVRKNNEITNLKIIYSDVKGKSDTFSQVYVFTKFDIYVNKSDLIELGIPFKDGVPIIEKLGEDITRLLSSEFDLEILSITPMESIRRKILEDIKSSVIERVLRYKISLKGGVTLKENIINELL